MAHQEPHIGEFVRILTPRLEELQGRAHARNLSPSVLAESLEHLSAAVEELRVTEEEMRLHDEEFAAREHRMAGDLRRAMELFEAAPDPFLVTDGAGAIRAANRAASAFLGVDADALARKPLALFVAEEDRPSFRARLRALASAGGTGRWTARLTPRRSGAVETELSVSLATQPDGDTAAYWTLREVRPGAAAEGGEDRELLRLLVRGAPVAMAVMDLDGTVLHWNAAAERLLGWTEEELLGRPSPALPDDEAGAAQEVAAEAARADGTRVRLALSLAPLVDASGAVRATVAVMTEAPETEAAPARPGAAGEGRRWSADDARRVLFGQPERGDFTDRLRTGIAAGVHMGYLAAGDRLPSIREAAQAAGVDHRVVSSAYRRLAAEGVVEVRNRHGVMVAGPRPRPESSLGETAEWLVEVLEDACRHQVKVAHLPELLRRWTGSARLRCACVESSADDLVALTSELKQQWGMDTVAVPLGKDAAPSRPGAGLAEELRAADLVVTTSFHAGTVAAAAEALGKPLVVVAANPEVVRAVEERLKEGPVTAVVADAEFGERLRGLAGGERLRVVLADDGAAVAALDPAEPVLLTRAAQQRLNASPRLLVPVAPFLSPGAAADIARVLVTRNIAAERALTC